MSIAEHLGTRERHTQYGSVTQHAWGAAANKLSQDWKIPPLSNLYPFDTYTDLLLGQPPGKKAIFPSYPSLVG